jgi:hypothetical protein
MIDVAAEPGPEGSFVATASWNVAGSVGHWSHIHERKNRYRAELAVAPVAGSRHAIRILRSRAHI